MDGKYPPLRKSKLNRFNFYDKINQYNIVQVRFARTENQSVIITADVYHTGAVDLLNWVEFLAFS